MKMKTLIFGLLILLSMPSMGQYKISEGVKYSPPFQIDSSNYFLFGCLIDKTNKSKYSSGGSEIYTNALILNGWTNLYVYNSESKQAKKLFSVIPILIYPVNHYYGNSMGVMNSAILKDCILIAAKIDEFNKDGIIDEEDPIYLFMASKDGSNVVQITPKDVNVTNWQISRDGKTILVFGQKDKNGDKKFTSEDESVYQIDFNLDFSKIKMTLINP